MALDLPTSLGPPPTLSTTDLPSDDEADDLDFAPDAAIPAAGPTSPSSEPDSDDDPAGPSIASSSRPSTRSTKRRRSRSASPPAGRSGEGGEDANADATPVLGYAELLAAAAAKGKGRAVEGVEEPRMVTIKVPRKFAGEVFLEEKLVPADSPEALAFADSVSTAASLGAETTINPSTTATPVNPTILTQPSTDSSNASTPHPLPIAPPSTAAAPAAPSLQPKRPPPKKKRGTLEALSASLVRPKKMTTLEKSAGDWKAQRAILTEAERDELERNRKKGGAGFLEKMDFLGRVDGRLGR